MNSQGSTGTYVAATGTIDLPRPRRRKHRPARQRHACATCTLPLVRPGAFHICVDLSAPEVVVEKPKKVKAAKKATVQRKTYGQLTPEQREAAKERDRKNKRKARLAARCPCVEDGCENIVSGPGKRCNPCRHRLNPSRPSKIAPHLDTIARRYQSGERIVDLAREYGVGEAGLRKAMRGAGVVFRKPIEMARKAAREVQLVMTLEQEQQAAAMYVGLQWPAKKIAEHFGVSDNTIRRALERQGVPRRPVGPIPRDAA